MSRAGGAETPSKKGIRRRSFLSHSLRAGGAVVALGGIGLAGRLWQTGAGGDLSAGPAFDPWRNWEDGSAEGIPGIIGAAILA
ncbi:MAG: hypothetical protein RLN70_05950, partial [Rhodospirillaceae bacterium]